MTEGQLIAIVCFLAAWMLLLMLGTIADDLQRAKDLREVIQRAYRMRNIVPRNGLNGAKAAEVDEEVIDVDVVDDDELANAA